MKKLSHQEFKATIDKPQQLTEGQPPFDFWAYVEKIPHEDYEGHDFSAGDIHKVYRMQNNKEHVLICSTTDNVYLGLVIDIEKQHVFGHCILNFETMSHT